LPKRLETNRSDWLANKPIGLTIKYCYEQSHAILSLGYAGYFIRHFLFFSNIHAIACHQLLSHHQHTITQKCLTKISRDLSIKYCVTVTQKTITNASLR
jgi:hypothetical protein